MLQLTGQCLSCAAPACVVQSYIITSPAAAAAAVGTHQAGATGPTGPTGPLPDHTTTLQTGSGPLIERLHVISTQQQQQQQQKWSSHAAPTLRTGHKQTTKIL